MLSELVIEDLALIERVSLTFGAGLNVITGETGAGKSLLIDGLELLLGHKARAGLVRQGANRARVEGRFLLAPPAETPKGSASRHESSCREQRVRHWLAEHLPDVLAADSSEDAEHGELELILTRTLLADGHTRAHVNHCPVTQRALRELASLLVEVHGQNDHQALLGLSEQLALLDAYAGLEGELERYRFHRQRWLAIQNDLARRQSRAAERTERIGFLRYQRAELGESLPSPTEHASLRAAREVLRHASALGEQLGGAVRDLSDGEHAVLDVLQGAERLIGSWQERVPDLAAPAGELRDAAVLVGEAVRALRSFADRLEADPVRLDEIERELDRLGELQRRYRTDLDGLVARRTAIEAELAELESEEQGTEELAPARDAARASMEESASTLTTGRTLAARRLERAVEHGLRELGLEQALFRVKLLAPGTEATEASDHERFSAHGTSSVEFELAANPGEPSQPLARVASGGEAARIMLALRGALALEQSVPTLVFDEVDAGVGGRLAPRVGTHLRQLCQHHQVLCITHLPAIAALADQHTRVYKEVGKNRTRTHVSLLCGEQRVQEIADMIAGGSAHQTARAEARRLLCESTPETVG